MGDTEIKSDMETGFRNARLVLHDSILNGALAVDQGCIAAIGDAQDAGFVDLDGDFLLPGFVELHTDNLERHALPRPQAMWPDLLASALAHDAEVAAAGITTVLDSLCVGSNFGDDGPRRQLLTGMVEAVRQGINTGVFRAEHQLHLRCELTDPHLLAELDPLIDSDHLSLVSLMDHTPGQRQWQDLDALRAFNRRSQQSDEVIEQKIQQRIQAGQRHVAANRKAVLNAFSHRAVVFASHDDTTVEHVLQSAEEGVTIAEFPCSMEAAGTAREKGIHTLGGAPNIVRGGSHSGNVAIAELADAGLLDALSSDYVPASLIQAVFTLTRERGWTLPAAVRLVSDQPASMLGLHDRGQLAVGRRADLVRVRLFGDTPAIRAVYRSGARVA